MMESTSWLRWRLRIVAGALMLVVLLSSACNCKEFHVGNNAGSNNWDIPPTPDFYQTWANRIDFYATDNLTFTYNQSLHDVTFVSSQKELDTCWYNYETLLSYDKSGFTTVSFQLGSSEDAVVHVMSTWYAKDCPLGMKFSLLVKGPGSRSPSNGSGTVTTIIDDHGLPTNKAPKKNVIIPWVPQTSPDWYVGKFLDFTVNSIVAFRFDPPFRVIQVDTPTHFDACDPNYPNALELRSGERVPFVSPGDYFFMDKGFTNCNKSFMKVTWTINGPALTTGAPVLSTGAPKASRSLKLKVIISIILVAVVVFILIGGLIVWFCLRRYPGHGHLGDDFDPRWLKRSRHKNEYLNQLMSGEKGSTICKFYTIKELKKATNNFGLKGVLGRGGFGTVYKGILSDGTEVAIKMSNNAGANDIEQFVNEVTVLSQVKNRNLVKLLGCCLDVQVPILVFEFIPNGTLRDHLNSSPPELDWSKRFNIAIQTAEALKYLHVQAGKPIIHRDVKSANILLDEELNAKVADFGLSKLVDMEATHVLTQAKGTFGYLDPEYHQTSQLTDKTDVYSFGVVLLELITSKKPMDPSLPADRGSLVLNCIPVIKKKKVKEIVDTQLAKAETFLDHDLKIIKGVAEVALACLGSRRSSRPSMSDVVKMLENLKGPNLDPEKFIQDERDGVAIKYKLKESFYQLLGIPRDSSQTNFSFSTSVGTMSSSQFSSSPDISHVASPVSKSSFSSFMSRSPISRSKVSAGLPQVAV